MKREGINIEKPSIPLSEEWAELSAAFCGPELIKSLGDFFEKNNVRTILEAACGDGHVLHGLSQTGIDCVGIDSDDYLLNRAKQINGDPKISYKKLDVTDLDKDEELRDKQFDAVMMRGNSITALGAWGTDKTTFNPEKCYQMIQATLIKMWSKVKDGGILFLDVTRQADIDQGDHEQKINLGDIHLTGVITIDQAQKRRDVFGYGTVNGEYFNGGSSSYLITPDELKTLLVELLKPQKVWQPTDVQEPLYEVICAKK
ncbi:MAG: class I SAM-dependent methyltransferase [Patescibacteria group bacterium]|jgi:SAM-dependent methyltransferase